MIKNTGEKEMKEIKIKSMALENFKCHEKLSINFNGGNATIYGDNATGKTSIYDALTWLLFGKDSEGNGEKNIEVKPLDMHGDVKDHYAETIVEAALSVNGEDVTLRRTFKEVWSTKRGSVVPTYDGNTSEYYIDGVPVKKNQFSDYINELVSEDTFRMLTSVSHFANDISWTDRRAVLFKVANIMDDSEIMAQSAEFAPLAEAMGRSNIDDYKKKLLAEKRGYVGAKNEIPARLNECQKTIDEISEIDFEAVRYDVERLNASKEDIDAQILAIEHDSAQDAKRIEIREAKTELALLEGENDSFKRAQRTGAPDISKLETELRILNTNLARKHNNLTNDIQLLETYKKNIEEARNIWITVHSEQFKKENCPTCGQTLPAEQLKKAEQSFEANRKKILDELSQKASDEKKNLTVTEARIEDTKLEIDEIEHSIARIKADIKAAEENRIVPVDMDGYADKQKAILDKINTLSGELADLMQSSIDVKRDLLTKKHVISAEIAELNAILGKQSLLDYSRQRIDSLLEDARKTAESLATIEQMLFLIEEYTRFKTSFVEDSINSMFRLAKFRLFREQANGGIEDRCDVTCFGVPYINVNNGAKINVGIDIINTLSTAYGVKVPLFVDNAESVTNLLEADTQIIRLVVSENDKEIRVSYEN